MFWLLVVKNLQGLNLLNISVLRIESHIELWKILVDMSLTYLAIDLCVLLPLEKDDQAEPEIISSFQECLNLKALEFHSGCRKCYECKCQCNVTEQNMLSVLSNFPSLTRCFVGGIYYDVNVIINGCSMLKCFTHIGCSLIFPWQLPTQNCNLEQFCIIADVLVPNLFMQSVSAHGALVHVILCIGILYGDGITALIQNSPKLLTCHIFVEKIRNDLPFSEFITFPDMKMIIKRKFSDRKLITCGSFVLLKRSAHFWYADNLLIEHHNTEIYSLWSTLSYGTNFYQVRYN